MLIATASNAMPVLTVGVGAVLLALLALWGLFRLARRFAVAGRIVCGLFALVATAGGLAGVVVFWFGLAIAGCPPDANDCPI